MPHHTDVQRDCPPREARSAEAAALRGQKSILPLSTLTHKLRTLIKHVRSERAGAAWRAARDGALVLETLNLCTKAPFFP